MRMEDLEKYVVVGRRAIVPAEPEEWDEPAAPDSASELESLPEPEPPPELESLPELEPPPEPEEPLCARCGEQKASVTLCESCFVEVAEGMSRQVSEPDIAQETPAARKRGILGWVGLLVLGLSILGLAAAMALLSLQH